MGLERLDLVVRHADRDMHVDDFPVALLLPYDRGQAGPHSPSAGGAVPGLIHEPAHRSLAIARRMWAWLEGEPLRLEAEPESRALGDPLAWRGANDERGRVRRDDVIELLNRLGGDPPIERQDRVPDVCRLVHELPSWARDFLPCGSSPRAIGGCGSSPGRGARPLPEANVSVIVRAVRCRRRAAPRRRGSSYRCIGGLPEHEQESRADTRI